MQILSKCKNKKHRIHIRDGEDDTFLLLQIPSNDVLQLMYDPTYCGLLRHTQVLVLNF